MPSAGGAVAPYDCCACLRLVYVMHLKVEQCSVCCAGHEPFIVCKTVEGCIKCSLLMTWHAHTESVSHSNSYMYVFLYASVHGKLAEYGAGKLAEYGAYAVLLQSHEVLERNKTDVPVPRRRQPHTAASCRCSSTASKGVKLLLESRQYSEGINRRCCLLHCQHVPHRFAALSACGVCM